MTLTELRARRSEILRVVSMHGGKPGVLVFGSVARGEAGPDSDLDLIVELAPDRSLFDRVRMVQELEDLLGARVETVSPRAIHPVLRERIYAEAQPL
jgi:predicted nucleotidyltransferase